MKKVIVMLAAILCGMAAFSQSDAEVARSRFLTFHKRDASQLHLQRQFPHDEVPQSVDAKDAQGLRLPDNVWFPGEWEEVKAIVVTCLYNYLVPGHENSIYWVADPIVSDIAQYYQYNATRGWMDAGLGPYSSEIDTVSEQGKVFFYIMDAIQLGGAEAWVRVEHADDSAIIVRQLARMGLRHDNLRFLVGPGNSFWFRDCGPIAFYYGSQDSIGMVDFEYYSGRALDDSLPTLLENQMGIPNYITSIEWEGGNCLVDGAGMVISSSAIYAGNADSYGQAYWDGSTIRYRAKARLSQAKVRDSLAHIMGSRATYILPQFQYDGGTGHIDLYADMIDENEFVFSKFPSRYSSWRDYATAAKNIDSLTNYRSVFDVNYKCHYIPFPSTDNGGYFSSQMVYDESYTRTYSNHTFVNNVIIQPCFSALNADGEPSKDWDRQNIDSVRAAYPGYTVYPINVKTFDGSGGAIHCVTKQIPADNPIRILHQSITRADGVQGAEARAIAATITNRSGIASATCYWRVDNGEWHEVAMTASGSNRYDCTMDFSQAQLAHGQRAVVDYYISATSNNGKTITKPMTALQEGYFTFDLVYDSSYVGLEPTVEGRFGIFFPNPTHDVAHIEVGLNEDRISNVAVYDVMGRRVAVEMQRSVNAYAVNTQLLPAGIYNVVFSLTNGQRVMRRLVVR